MIITLAAVAVTAATTFVIPRARFLRKNLKFIQFQCLSAATVLFITSCAVIMSGDIEAGSTGYTICLLALISLADCGILIFREKKPKAGVKFVSKIDYI